MTKKPSRPETSRSRKSRSTALPPVAVIGGSQAFRFLEKSYEKESLGARKTPFGASSPIHLVRSASAEYLFLSRHGETGYTIAAPFVNYRANIYALKDFGVKHVLSWSGPGAISPDYTIGQFVIVDDIIDETRRRPSTFFEHGGLGFIRQNPVFCPHLRKLLEESLHMQGIKFAGAGTYVCTEGPRLETPAEIRKFASYGAHLVGMTLVPELFLARELEMCYAAICYVTNYAEGMRKKAFRAGVLFEGLASKRELEKVENSVARFPAIVEAVANGALEREPDCMCANSMQRYRKRGDIGRNWREWIRA